MPYKHWPDVSDNAKIDFYYRMMVRVKKALKDFPESTFQGIVNELRYRKAYPVICEQRRNHTYGVQQNYGSCPRCKRKLKSGTTYKQFAKDGIGPRYDFCPRCGQHLDWSDFEITDLHTAEALMSHARVRRERLERERQEELERERQWAEQHQSLREEADVAGLENPDD